MPQTLTTRFASPSIRVRPSVDPNCVALNRLALHRLALRCVALFVFGVSLWNAPTVCWAQNSTPSDSMSILAWNIESGGSEVATIARELTKLEPFDILALSEVPQESTATFVGKWGKEHSIVGETGGPARILITWNPKVFDKIETLELRSFQGKEFAPGIQFSPSVAHLKHKPSGAEFILVMNHFTRGSAELRKSQALLLADWGRNQKQPCIAVGGYNFDYDFPTKKGNESFSAFMETKVWKWIEPLEWVDNNWADRNRDGKDDYPDSMLDFTFTCHTPDSWKITSKVVVRDGDFPDNDKTSDHRPMLTTVSGLTLSKSR